MRERFLALKSARDVAALLEVEYSHFTYHLYKSTSSQKYTTFTIPKRSGGEREIKAPISSIKILPKKTQYSFATGLQAQGTST
jgi:RNA-directed DNA polymerase